MLILGIDEAGRGPVMGPLVVAGVLINEKQRQYLKKNKIRDSKIVFRSEREKLSKLIKKYSVKHEIVKTYPKEMDHYLTNGTNLNTLEALEIAKIINSLNTEKFHKTKIKVFVDCPSPNTMAWRALLMTNIKYKQNLEVRCEHKADANHISVAAASILAKTIREEEVAKIKEKFSEYGDTGSGYSHDPITQKFLKEHGKKLCNEGIFRKSWSTWKKLFPGQGQATLGDFN